MFSIIFPVCLDVEDVLLLCERQSFIACAVRCAAQAGGQGGRLRSLRRHGCAFSALFQPAPISAKAASRNVLVIFYRNATGAAGGTGGKLCAFHKFVMDSKDCLCNVLDKWHSQIYNVIEPLK